MENLTIYLVRHGEKTLDGSQLSKKGIKQAKFLSKRLAKNNFKKIYSSDLTRCKQTAEIVNKNHNLSIIFKKELREVPGKVKDYPKKHKKEIEIIKNFHKKLSKERGNIFVSSSGIVNRILLSLFLEITPDKANFIQNPTGLNIIDRNPEKKKFRIICINETSHLPQKFKVRQRE